MFRLIVLPLIATAALALTVPALAGVQFTSNNYTSVSGDLDTYSIANGDFNNDGILDLVTINTDTLSFYAGSGSGSFAAPISQTIPVSLGQVFAADVNGDGKLDLVIGGSNSAQNTVITILLGNGDGTFKQGTNISVNGSAEYITMADFNGDHIPDIAASVATQNGCNTQVFLGQGNGDFKQSATLSVYGCGAIVAGDFNADGKQDIAEVAADGVVVYLGNGNGTFQSPLLAMTSAPTVTEALAVGNFFDNNIQTLATLTEDTQGPGGPTTYYVQTVQYQNGSLVPSKPETATTEQYFGYIAAGDLNGDFKDDIVLVGGNIRAYPLTAYMLGNGNGTFQRYQSLPAYGAGESFPFIRDLNLDSRHDIGAAWDGAYGDEGSGALILLNDSAKTNCDPPPANALSVNVCAPSEGAKTGTTIAFKAAGNAFNGIAKRMELWIDGTKVGQDLEDQLKITTTLSKGSHTASFVVVDTFDNTASKSVTFMVN